MSNFFKMPTSQAKASEKTDNPKGSEENSKVGNSSATKFFVVEAARDADKALRDAKKGFRRAQYEIVGQIYLIAEALKESEAARKNFSRVLGFTPPKDPTNILDLLEWVMKSMTALSRDKASLWLRAFRTLEKDGMVSSDVAKAVEEGGGFKALATRSAKTRQPAVSSPDPVRNDTPNENSEGAAFPTPSDISPINGDRQTVVKKGRATTMSPAPKRAKVRVERFAHETKAGFWGARLRFQRTAPELETLGLGAVFSLQVVVRKSSSGQHFEVLTWEPMGDNITLI